MQGIYYVQFKLIANTLTAPRALVCDMNYVIDVLEIAESEIIEAVQMSPTVLRVVVKLYLELDMEQSDLEELLQSANYAFHYDDGHQRIESTEMLSVSEEPETNIPAASAVDGEDLFQHPELWPADLGIVVNHYAEKLEEEASYDRIREFKAKVEDLGFTFDYGLDAVPYDLRRKVYPAVV